MIQSRRDALRTLGRTGLAVATGSILAVTLESRAMAAQSGWRWCRFCKQLWFRDYAFYACPGRPGLGHSNEGSGNYSVLFANDPGNGTSDWRYCRFCKTLWFARVPNGPSSCPALSGGLGQHSIDGSGNYKVEFASSGGGQPSWRLCNLCKALWYYDGNFGTGRGVCSFGIAFGTTRTHSGESGTNYQLRTV